MRINKFAIINAAKGCGLLALGILLSGGILNFLVREAGSRWTMLIVLAFSFGFSVHLCTRNDDRKSSLFEGIMLGFMTFLTIMVLWGIYTILLVAVPKVS